MVARVTGLGHLRPLVTSLACECRRDPPLTPICNAQVNATSANRVCLHNFSTFLALAPPPAMLAYRTPATFLALAPPPAMLAYRTPATFLALAPLPAILAYLTPATFPALAPPLVVLAYCTSATFPALAPPLVVLAYCTPATFPALAPPLVVLAYCTPAKFHAPVLLAPMPAQLAFAGQMVGLPPIGKPLIQVIPHEHLALIAPSRPFFLPCFSHHVQAATTSMHFPSDKGRLLQDSPGKLGQARENCENSDRTPQELLIDVNLSTGSAAVCADLLHSVCACASMTSRESIARNVVGV